MIVVLDCNIWISLALNQQLDFISSLQKNKITIATCKNLQEELTNVLLRPKFRKYFSQSYTSQFLQFYKLVTKDFELANIENVVSDPKDDYLFALCQISNADYFVTGDKLLLEIPIHGKTIVATLADFKRIIVLIN
ncbi:putative toxin-antitoxin system toxin component, PIN family [Mucilaginibacter sp. SJ]|uniref:putative toxin-antitoxin system toxin component, PIN family n=1 Tax=Mucilaginibacter sp. SJ TaxID=3029053 RepID=UPI0023A9A590|nr:putative toxin-antitoxin system toxin component, PIN family [Mucilaginibacter sp. SJ]WDZ99374.1 putative toxin-antitoxin system toxin component, PIN family [Mucilaginibacter sp. SJ]